MICVFCSTKVLGAVTQSLALPKRNRWSLRRWWRQFSRCSCRWWQHWRLYPWRCWFFSLFLLLFPCVLGEKKIQRQEGAELIVQWRFVAYGAKWRVWTQFFLLASTPSLGEQPACAAPNSVPATIQSSAFQMQKQLDVVKCIYMSAELGQERGFLLWRYFLKISSILSCCRPQGFQNSYFGDKCKVSNSSGQKTFVLFFGVFLGDHGSCFSASA